MEDDFINAPPDFEHSIRTDSGFFPPNAESAWMLKLIETKLDNTSLPEDLKKSMANDMSLYITTAGMTHITKNQIIEFLCGFEEVWNRYVIFNIQRKYRPELYYAFGFLKELFVLNLNKSIEGWQGDRVFERRTTYDITQKRKDISDKVKGFFFKRKVKTTEREETES
jgi:hypothetical protein